MRRDEAGQGAREPIAHLVDLVGVEEHRVGAAEQPFIDLRRQAVDVAHLDRHAVQAGDLGELAELAGRHVAGGDEQYRGGVGRRGAEERRGGGEGMRDTHQKSACRARLRLRPGCE